VGRERIPARPTKRQHLSKSSPTPKHSVTISTSTQRLSDPLLKLVPIGIYMYLCSLRTIFKAGSLRQSDCLEAGTARPTIQVY
jgi:hypothetical protein